MRDDCFMIDILPNIEMYGGSTDKWRVVPLTENNAKIPYIYIGGCIVTLTIAPFKASTGLGRNANSFAPVLEKAGKVERLSDDSGAIIFDFQENDTKSLRGKFIYQIEIKNQKNVQICQGHIYIRQNVNI